MVTIILKKETLLIGTIVVILSLAAIISLDYGVYQEVFVANGISLSFWGIVLMVLFTGPATIFAVKLLSFVMTLPFTISPRLVWIAVGVVVLQGALKVIEKSSKEM